MKHWCLTFCLVIASLFGSVGLGNAANLPNCPTQGYGWHNCFGTYTDLDGTTYVGEYKDNKPHEQGTHTWKNGDKLIGQFKNGYAEGQALARTKEV